MSQLLHQALAKAQRAHDESRDGFGLERYTTAGAPVPPTSFEFEESLKVLGNGTITLTTRRSFADVSSEQIGEFGASLPPEAVGELIQLIQQARLDELPPFRVEPSDTKVRLTVVAAGTPMTLAVGVNDPDALRPVKPLLQRLDGLAFEARQHPVITLRLGMETDTAATMGSKQIPVVLSFRNTGSRGYWLTHPHALRRSSGLERCDLRYGRQPPRQPGVTPLPMTMFSAALEPAGKEDDLLMWIPPDTAIEQRFMVPVEFQSPGAYLARAIYSTYDGEDSIAGASRLRGAAVSNQVTILVSK